MIFMSEHREIDWKKSEFPEGYNDEWQRLYDELQQPGNIRSQEDMEHGGRSYALQLCLEHQIRIEEEWAMRLSSEEITTMLEAFDARWKSACSEVIRYNQTSHRLLRGMLWFLIEIESLFSFHGPVHRSRMQAKEERIRLAPEILWQLRTMLISVRKELEQWPSMHEEEFPPPRNGYFQP
ncbi:MAG: hypothetical protein Greene041662_659 [Candidatus Peregrinibacteria bacterium Greene0416_62]|nr:MAG: hypothetical protein Greene041662_659 [Candidatus Peregrinibacteria bacterium Greene0416_62]